jgi:hypothetical protein
VDIGAFTETFFKEWYQIYKDSVLSRKSGVDAAGENFASPEGSSKGNFDNLRALSIRNRAGQLIGGYVLQIIESSTKKILKIRFAAFKEGDMSPNIKYQSLNLGYRAYDEVVKWAMSDKTFTTLSYGSDPNLYCDEIASPGLHQFKRELGFVPTFWHTGGPGFSDTRLLKILDRTHIGNFYLHYVFPDNNSNNPLEIEQEGTPPTDFSLMPISH